MVYTLMVIFSHGYMFLFTQTQKWLYTEKRFKLVIPNDDLNLKDLANHETVKEGKKGRFLH